jgi:hypothetical protein
MADYKQGERVRITCHDGEVIHASLVRDLRWCPDRARLLVNDSYHASLEHGKIRSIEHRLEPNGSVSINTTLLKQLAELDAH